MLFNLPRALHITSIQIGETERPELPQAACPPDSHLREQKRRRKMLDLVISNIEMDIRRNRTRTWRKEQSIYRTRYAGSSRDLHMTPHGYPTRYGVNSAMMTSVVLVQAVLRPAPSRLAERGGQREICRPLCDFRVDGGAVMCSG